ncbi:hypothetical protein GOODEAATRI_022079 [Goodea atripinnis]|uniref:Uncharacterized protein n=1 Tax=Goodea atripinnis TaxID=208336 RepID=A0ABV0NMB2_9TELE
MLQSQGPQSLLCVCFGCLWRQRWRPMLMQRTLTPLHVVSPLSHIVSSSCVKEYLQTIHLIISTWSKEAAATRVGDTPRPALSQKGAGPEAQLNTSHSIFPQKLQARSHKVSSLLGFLPTPLLSAGLLTV